MNMCKHCKSATLKRSHVSWLYKHVALLRSLYIRCIRRAFSASELTRVCCSAKWTEIVVDDLVPCCTDFPKQAHRSISQFVLLSNITSIHACLCSSRAPRIHTLGKHEMSRRVHCTRWQTNLSPSEFSTMRDAAHMRYQIV